MGGARGRESPDEESPDEGDAASRRYLLPSERLVAEVHWHPVWLLRPTLVLIGGLLLLGVMAGGVSEGNVFSDVLGLVALGLLGYYGWRVLEWRSERLLVTDRRLLLVTGLLARRVEVMPLVKVTDMTFEQPLPGRLFGAAGWGTFVFDSAGQEGALSRVPYLPHPHELFQELTDQIFGENGLYGRGAAPFRRPPPRPADRPGVGD